MTAPARTQRFLTLAEVSELLRTPEATLRWWRYRGIGPRSFRCGRRVLYERSDVEAYIAELRDSARGGDHGGTSYRAAFLVMALLALVVACALVRDWS